jgi:hypothetical protein
VVSGPVPWHELSPDQTEQLISALLVRLHPDALRIDGSGGDGGCDIRIPLDGGDWVVEIKSFTARLATPQRRQIERSLQAAIRNYAGIKPVDLGVAARPDPE